MKTIKKNGSGYLVEDTEAHMGWSVPNLETAEQLLGRECPELRDEEGYKYWVNHRPIKTKGEIIKQYFENFVCAGDESDIDENDPMAHAALDLYAKEVVFYFLKFKEQFQLKEKEGMAEKYKKAGGMFSWIGAHDQEIFNEFLKTLK